MNDRLGALSDYVTHHRQRITKALLRSYALKAVPLRIRPAIVFILAAWLIVLGILGMAPLPSLPINDKILHFFGMGLATFLLYFVIEVPDASRRVWFYRRAPLMFTLFFGFFCGGVLSEIIQSYLPWKTFQFGDILANLLGCLLSLAAAHHLTLRSRRRLEISRLYRPISSASYSRAGYQDGRLGEYDDDEDEDLEQGRTAGRPRAGSDAMSVGEGEVWDDDLGGYEYRTSGYGRPAAGGGAGNGTSTGGANGGQAGAMFGLGEDEEADTPRKGGPGSAVAL